MLDGGKLEEAEPAFQQLGKIIRDFIKNSVGGSGYARALEAMRVMREEASDLEIPDVYNDFVRNLKTAILKEELNGDRKDMWFMIRANRMGLIQSKECGSSEIKEDEAKEFLTVRLSV